LYKWAHLDYKAGSDRTVNNENLLGAFVMNGESVPRLFDYENGV